MLTGEIIARAEDMRKWSDNQDNRLQQTENWEQAHQSTEGRHVDVIGSVRNTVAALWATRSLPLGTNAMSLVIVDRTARGAQWRCSK